MKTKIFILLGIFALHFSVKAQNYLFDSTRTHLINETEIEYQTSFLVIPNADCKIIIDFQERAIIRGDDGLQIGINYGEHLFEAVLLSSDEKWRKEITITTGQKIIRPIFTNIDNKQINREQQENTIFVQGGTFIMGNNSSSVYGKYPLHPVTLSDFYIDKYEVTNLEYCEFLNEQKIKSSASCCGIKYLKIESKDCQIEFRNDSFICKTGKENFPVIEVSWYGASEYCRWKGGRLPSEAEWEYAATGGYVSRGYKYAGSNSIDKVAWYGDNADKSTHQIGQKEPNELGIYDMSGNVWEWCYDWYDFDFYKNCQQNDPINYSVTNHKVIRGGSWFNYALNCRTRSYSKLNPYYSYNYVGFRVCYPVK